jgi:hypothetical protein
MYSRRDPPRRVTPELMAFYKKRAHQLRAEAIRNTGSALWASLMRIIGL